MDHVTGRTSGGGVTLPGVQQAHTSTTIVEGNLVSLTEVVQNSLLHIKQQADALQAIIRYDGLPAVIGNEKGLQNVFKNIFHSIIAHPPADNKLFIYIRCENCDSDVMDLQLPDGYKKFEISVYTNITTDAEWQQQYQSEMEQAKQFVESIKGAFSYHQITNTGCLYELELIGKLN